jgi:hypothetical protein
LGIKQVVNTVLVTDGYAPYKQYAEKTGIHHARCGAHSRRAPLVTSHLMPFPRARHEAMRKSVFEPVPFYSLT